MLLLALGAAAALGGHSLTTDSVTFDESEHVTAGAAVLLAGDYRMVHNNPPLARTMLALPVAAAGPRWLAEDDPFWRGGNDLGTARRFLFELNDGQALVVRARWVALALLVATCLATWALARRLLGPAAAAAAVVLAALDPNLLAHGRLATPDVPMALATAVTLLALAALADRVTVARAVAFALAFSFAVLVKLSWPLLLPSVVAVLAGVRRDRRGGVRASELALVVTVWCVVTVAAVWAAYGFQRSVAPGDPEAAAAVERRWAELVDPSPGRPAANLLRGGLDATRGLGVVPDGYLLAIAEMLETAGPREAYALGESRGSGWWWYFPLALAVKTPLPTLLLLAAGLAALVLRRAAVRDRALARGAVVLVVTWAAVHLAAPLNIGVRHLLPMWPVLLAAAGAATGWLALRAARVALAGAAVWLAAGTLAVHPGYLAFFNELAGGPAGGWRVLADSNLDWGQDLLRLARWAGDRPGRPVRLAYFGTAVPTRYLEATALPSTPGFGPRAGFGPGAYVVSVNQLLGLHDIRSQPQWWRPERRARYAAVLEALEDGELEDAERAAAAEEAWELAAHRLLSRLRNRPPDERVGWTLFVYHLDEEEIRGLIRP